MSDNVHDIPLPEAVNDMPLQPAEACTELEFSGPSHAVEQTGRVERYLAAMRRWLGTDGISTEN
jgi:hypothetical protein